MLGYSEKSYGWRGLALDKHWDSQCPAMEHSVRKQRSHFLLVLELWGPDSSWKQQFNWRAVLCSSRNLWKNFGWLIHNSPGAPRNMWLGWDPWHSCKGESESLLPLHNVGSNRASLTQVTLQSPWEGLVSLLQHRAGMQLWDASWGCCCGEESVRELAPHPGITHAMIWEIHPSQFMLQTFMALCVCVFVCDVNSALRDSALGVQPPAGLGFQVLLAMGWPGVIKPNDLFTQNPKGKQLQPRAK